MDFFEKDCFPRSPHRNVFVVGPCRIGPVVVDPPVIMAPMAGVTDGPFLEVVSRFGVGMVTTEMMSAEGFRRNDPSCRRMLEVPSRVRVPVAIQIFGADPDVMAEAARAAQDSGAAVIDINAGCPIRKIVRQGSGAALMRDPDRLARIVETVKRAVAVPVTVKTRLGWDKNAIDVVDVCRRIQEAGADAVTLHARTARQIYTGTADWSWIRRLKDDLSIPVIGNGDVTCPADFHRMMRETGCDAVMIGRGALGNPWLFRAIAEQCRARAPSLSCRKTPTQPSGGFAHALRGLTPERDHGGHGHASSPAGITPATTAPHEGACAYLSAVVGWGEHDAPHWPGRKATPMDHGHGGHGNTLWEEFRRTVREHAELFMQEKPKAFGALRKHLVWYTKGCPNASGLRARIMTAPDFPSLWAFFDQYISELAASGTDLLACKVRGKVTCAGAEEMP
ncbi:tRNA dihydrouridine synthase DusB [Desulfosoma sp.]